MDEGQFMQCFSMRVQSKFDDWVLKNDLLNGRDFWIDFKISTKIQVRCLCFIDLSGDEPVLRVRRRVYSGSSIPKKDENPRFLVRISALDWNEAFC